jgi:hypothetical protein
MSALELTLSAAGGLLKREGLFPLLFLKEGVRG